MFKTLIKKQFLELNQSYFQDRKKGKRRTNEGIAAYVVLFLFIFGIVGFLFYSISTALADAFIIEGFMAPNNREWLYFAMLAFLAVILGTFGSVFNTYAGLYLSKDNEQLLSMPIPPKYILGSRMVGVIGMSLLYSALVWIPAVIVYWSRKIPSVTGIIFPILLQFVIALLVTVLTCVLGWLVALISSRLKNKSFVTVIVSLAFFAGYYYVCFRMNKVITAIISNADAIGERFKTWGYLLGQIGQAALGEVMPMLIASVIVIAAFIICYAVLSAGFTKIVTTNRGEKKANAKLSKVKSGSVKSALLKRELKRFTSCATYMLNAGLGAILLPGLTIAAVIKFKSAGLENVLALLGGIDWLLEYIPLGIACIVCMVISMNVVSAPSVSLEGKNLWIVRSLPVDTWQVLSAKENLHVAFNSIPAVACTLVLGCLVEAEITTLILMVAMVWIFVWFTADFGLMINLLKPNLTWTNEAIPIKQSASVFIVLFGGMIISVAMGLGFYFLHDMISGKLYMALCTAVLAVLFGLMHLWIRKKGVERFENL